MTKMNRSTAYSSTAFKVKAATFWLETLLSAANMSLYVSFLLPSHKRYH